MTGGSGQLSADHWGTPDINVRYKEGDEGLASSDDGRDFDEQKNLNQV
jgi:hypothetical protein